MELKEIEAEALAGFMEAIRKADPEREGLGSFLWWEIYRHLGRVVVRAFREIPVDDIEVAARTQGDLESSGDLLANAVHDGVLTAGDATLISETRLEGERLGAVAQRLGLRYHACRQRRARAEDRLAGYILINGVGDSANGDSAADAEWSDGIRRAGVARTRHGSEDAA